MKKTVKRVFALSMLFCAAAATLQAQVYHYYSGQSSNTSISTKTIFTTDTDDFIDVTSFLNTKENTENLFAFTKFYSSRIDAGLAHSFGDIYTALYFNGYLSQIKITSDDLDNSSSTFGANSFNMAVLLGIGDIGIKLGGYVAPDYTKEKTSGTTTTDKNTSNYEVFLNIGTSSEAASYEGTIGFTYDINRTAEDTFTSGYYNTLYAKAAATFSFDREGTLTQAFGIAAEDDFKFYPKTVDGTTEQKITGDRLIITPSYKLVYGAEEVFSIGAKVQAPVTLSIENNTTAETSDVTLSIIPTLRIGAQYKATEKLTLNGGMYFGLGNLFTWQYAKTTTEKENTFSIFPSGLITTLSTGASYKFTPKVMLDTTFTIFSTSSGGEYVTSLDDIWNANLGFELSLHL